MAGRFIKLYDKILQWEWYSDINTFRLFIHLLLKANYKDLKFEGQTILRGQLVTSLPKLASQTGLSVRQVRVSLDKLKLTGELTDKSFNRYRVITVVKYDQYQAVDRQNDRQMTGELSAKRQADDRQMTGRWQADDRQMTASIDNIEYIEDVEQIEQIDRERKTAKRFIPPSRDELEIFCLENGLSIDVDRFLNYYTANGWMVGRNKMKDWQATVRNWAKRDSDTGSAPVAQRGPKAPQGSGSPARRMSADNFPQRDYSDVNRQMMNDLEAEMEQARRDGII
jgi:hypothetical protein